MSESEMTKFTYQGEWRSDVGYSKGDVVDYRPEPPGEGGVWEWIRTRVFWLPARPQYRVETRSFMVLQDTVDVGPPPDDRYWLPLTGRVPPSTGLDCELYWPDGSPATLDEISDYMKGRSK